MKILSFLFPGFTALDLIGPTTVWGLLASAEFQTVARKLEQQVARVPRQKTPF